MFDVIVCNANCDDALLDGMSWVKLDDDLMPNYAVYQGDLISTEEPWHHDESKLAQVLIDIYQDRTATLADSV
ncbi:MAG TPA: hypothetical protein DEH25_05045 [Chloroflexi bacterium]|nr:hypothetical protein [Chloroflexota bacterium]